MSAALRAAREGTLASPAERASIDAFADANREVLNLVRSATDAPFDGFRLPPRFRYAPVHQLSWVLTAEVLTRVGLGDGDRALEHIADLVALRRAGSDSAYGLLAGDASFERIGLLTSVTLADGAPSRDAVARLASRLEYELDEANALADAYRLDRASFIDDLWQWIRQRRPLGGSGRLAEFALRPAYRSRANEHLLRMDALVNAAERPGWPDRLAEIERLGSPPPDLDPQALPIGLVYRPTRLLAAGFYVEVARAHARQTTLQGVLRTVLDVDEFRQLNGRLPETLTELAGAAHGDPLAATRLRYRPEDDGYVVYGVGHNGQDDGGDLGELNPFGIGWSVPAADSPDWGVRVRLPAAASAQAN